MLFALAVAPSPLTSRFLGTLWACLGVYDRSPCRQSGHDPVDNVGVSARDRFLWVSCPVSAGVWLLIGVQPQRSLSVQYGLNPRSYLFPHVDSSLAKSRLFFYTLRSSVLSGS